eukprot:116398_1
MKETTMELQISNHVDNKETDEETLLDEIHCFCGNKLIYHNNISSEEKNKCYVCELSIKEYYSCDTEDVSIHPKDYTFCMNCMEYVKDFKLERIKQIHQIEKLYFICHNNKIEGPLTVEHIITLYVTNKLKKNQFWIQGSWRKGFRKNWYKVELPENINCEKSKILYECATINKKIAINFPEIYTDLIQQILIGQLHKLSPPEGVPNDAKISFSATIIRIFGKIIAILMMSVLMLHCASMLVPCILLFCFWCIISMITKCGGDDFDMYTILVLTGYFGLILTPSLGTYLILSQTIFYDEIQSWMIAWIVWGCMSCLSSIGQVGICLNSNKNNKCFDNVNKIILFVIGVDFGEFNLNEIIGCCDFGTLFGSIFLFPALASCLPAAMCGFIANFILEKKVQLKCSDSIDDDTLCFEDYGCCELVSNRDFESSYVFLGGLASNIIATWAIIRICGYLLVNAFQTLAIHAKKKK